MKKVYKGSEFKKWFESNRDVRRVLEPTRTSFHILNLDEIEDGSYYLVTERYAGEVVIEEVDMVT